MSAQTPPQPPNRRPKSRTPAERAVEFTETQRRLKQEAADRRASAKSASSAPKPDADAGQRE
jgi:hypothetical protein